MTIALLADIHGNLEALDAVLADLDKNAPGAALFVAGDVVGYGPDPAACLERLLKRGARMVRGNHEEMILGVRDDRRCVASGIWSVAWTRRRLQAYAPHALEHMRALPAHLEHDGIVVCHGAPGDAGIYTHDSFRCERALEDVDAVRPHCRVLVVGHTHVAAVFTKKRGLVRPGVDAFGVVTELDPKERALVNPGAVGQSRDGVVVARYALLDDDCRRVVFRCVGYDHRATVDKTRAHGLPPSVTFKKPSTALEVAKARAQAKAVRTLLDHGGDLVLERIANAIAP